jgi:3-(3-hydroxy-phenyl)propionate hydroxylase
MLLAGLERFEHVEVRLGTRLETLEDDAGGTTATLRGPDGAARVHARFVLGCDGGRSSVRALRGIEMAGSSFPEPWIVIDVVEDPHRERYAMHHGDPRRPHVVLPGRDGRCRYEFLLLPGEDPEEAAAFPFVAELLAPHRPELTPHQVVRSAVYQFHAIVAERWTDGPVLLLGDAAHMMPPFAGQGLNSAVRDAHNLAWKLAAVVRGDAGEELLATYEAERRPHAEAMIRLSARLGRVIMTTSRARAHARDLLWAVAGRVPRLRRYVTEMRFKPESRYADGAAVRERGLAHPLAGRLLPQPRVLLPDLRLVPLDDLLGPGFAVLQVQASERHRPVLQHPLWRQLGARVVELLLDDRMPSRNADGMPSAADADGDLSALLGDCRGRLVVVRPDRYVAGVFEEADEQRFADALAARLSAPPQRAAARR